MASDAKPELVPEELQRFDLGSFPRIITFDTGVWLRALGWADDERTQICKDLFAATEHQKCDVLMCTPTLAEILRGDPKRKPPQRKPVLVVAFDRKCAIALQELVAPWKNPDPEKGDGPKLKFDAMIIASAVRWKSSCVVSVDEDFSKAAPRAATKLNFKRPVDFLTPIEKKIALEKAAEKKSQPQDR